VQEDARNLAGRQSACLASERVPDRGIEAVSDLDLQDSRLGLGEFSAGATAFFREFGP
jgi:hypothetical protein